MLPAFTWLIAHFFVSISRAEKVRTFGHTLRLVCQHPSSSRAGRANGVAGRRPRYALAAPRRSAAAPPIFSRPSFEAPGPQLLGEPRRALEERRALLDDRGRRRRPRGARARRAPEAPATPALVRDWIE